jgi:hypothetical protein
MGHTSGGSIPQAQLHATGRLAHLAVPAREKTLRQDSSANLTSGCKASSGMLRAIPVVPHCHRRSRCYENSTTRLGKHAQGGTQQHYTTTSQQQQQPPAARGQCGGA